MVGREGELKELKTFLDKAREGHGNLVFISGEAGVGKTKLVEELKEYAREEGVDVLQGWSLYESLTPYMPFLEALRSGGLESLFAEEVPKVEAVYLLNGSGLTVKEIVRRETKLDSDIFSGMLTVVGDFVKDSLSMLTGKDKEGRLNSLGYEDYRILIESRGKISLVVILTGKENEFLINDMKRTLEKVDKQYGKLLAKWNGENHRLQGIENVLESLISSGKYGDTEFIKGHPKIKRNWLFENISLGLERYTKNNPSLLCIEDLQWADPSTLALMHYVTRNTKESKLLILGTYRPEDVGAPKEGKVHPLIDTLQVMSREDIYHTIDLERLEEQHIDEMLTVLLGKNEFTVDLKKQLQNETEGNPFFIVSLVRMLIEEKTIEKRDEVWTLAKDLHEANIPSKVNDVIVRRLNRVRDDERKTLDYASVLGTEFTSDILAHATQLSKVNLLKHLSTLEQKHKLIRSHDGRFKFDHAKIKEVLYSQIPMELRMEYHAIIADVIETQNKDDIVQVVGDLAFHYYHCRKGEKALVYLINAAEMAKKNYSNEEAIRFYSEALEFEADSQKRARIFEATGDIYELIGYYNKSIHSYKSALELVNKKEKIAEIKAKMGNIFLRKGERDESIKICTEALELVKNEKSKEEAFVIHVLGNVHWLSGEYDIAVEHYEKSLKIREAINDQIGIARSLHNIGMMQYWREDYQRALEYLKESQKISEKIQNLYFLAYCLLSTGYVYENMEEYDKALENYEKTLDIGEKIGSKKVMSWYYSRIAEVYFRKKDLKKAMDYCNRTFDLSTKIGAKESTGNSRGTYGMIYREQKMWKESIENFEINIKILKEIGDKWHLGDSYYEYALMWKAKGEDEKAESYLNQALDVYKEMKLKKHMEKVERELGSIGSQDNIKVRP
jgi:predicted ATPase